MHGAPGKQQGHFASRLIAPIYRVVISNELVIADNLLPSQWIGELGVEAHRGSAIGGQFRDGGANTRAFVFAQGEGAVWKCPANVAGVKRAFAEDPLL